MTQVSAQVVAGCSSGDLVIVDYRTPRSKRTFYIRPKTIGCLAFDDRCGVVFDCFFLSKFFFRYIVNGYDDGDVHIVAINCYNK